MAPHSAIPPIVGPSIHPQVSLDIVVNRKLDHFEIVAVVHQINGTLWYGVSIEVVKGFDSSRPISWSKLGIRHLINLECQGLRGLVSHLGAGTRLQSTHPYKSLVLVSIKILNMISRSI